MLFRTHLSAVCFVVLSAGTAHGYTNTLFQKVPTDQLTFPSRTNGVEIELPDFDELFSRIQEVSPLAKVAITGGIKEKRGLDAIDGSCKFLKGASTSAHSKRGALSFGAVLEIF